jgi:hypothetical protein
MALLGISFVAGAVVGGIIVWRHYARILEESAKLGRAFDALKGGK